MTTTTRAARTGGSNPSKGPLIDAEPVRQHIRQLMAAGVSIQRIAAAAHVNHSVISAAIYRRGDRDPVRRIRVANANAILNVQAHKVITGRVDATGTRRRVQALMANGWSQLQLGRHLGLHPGYVTELMRARTVYGTTAHAVAAAYNRLWDKNPLDYGVHLSGVTRNRNYAKAQGWPPPAAWDDETIDDPNVGPFVGEEVPKYMAQGEDALWLREQGYTDDQIADRFGVAKNYLQQSIRRYLDALAQADCEAAA